MRVFDEAGIPCVQICSIISIAKTNKTNRIIRANKIPHPVGFPDLPLEENNKKRLEMLMKALKALGTSIQEQTLFE
ncbi:hypothetical protein KKB69_00025 [Patescibacteria group bacterium]|nr:hypothetical protein [Patescibacteria group bacterium]